VRASKTYPPSNGAEGPEPSLDVASGSYVTHHLDPGKGAQYDGRYATDSWLRYVSAREAEVLDGLWRTLFRRRPIRLLDFACGTGRILAALEDRAASAIGVDVSEPMLAEARKKVKRSHLLRANILEEPVLAGEQFDLITAFRFFVNAEPALRADALHALGQLLAPDGYLVFNDHHNPRSIRWGYARLATALRHEAPAVKYLPVRDCIRLAEEGGFEVVSIHSVGLLHLPRLKVFPALCRFCDRAAGHSRMLSAVSECPIFVCRRKTAGRQDH
jgi:SAM-dependent methyltransferase